MSAPLCFVLDEHLRRKLWNAVQRHNAKGGAPLNVAQVGDPPDLPLHAPDPEILIWAEKYNRVVVTRDQSMCVHFSDPLTAGRHSPGVVVLRSRSLAAAVIDLETIAYARLPGEWFDRIDYYP